MRKYLGTFILGDASYQTSGSRFQHEALFEVVRDDKREGGLRIELDPSIKMITFITISYNQVSFELFSNLKLSKINFGKI